MEPPSVRTARLELVAATREIVQAERYSPEMFPGLLRATVPAEWPPPLNSEHSLNWTLQHLLADSEAAGWYMWYFLLPAQEGGRLAIGNGGFKGRPDAGGTVEVGYSLLKKFEGMGYATEATRGLIAWAFEHHEVNRVTAETYPHLKNSIRVLEKCGLGYTGEGSELLTIRFELTRDEFARMNATK